MVHHISSKLMTNIAGIAWECKKSKEIIFILLVRRNPILFVGVCTDGRKVRLG